MKFTQNSVPFDFDGQHLLYMEYREKGIMHIARHSVRTVHTRRMRKTFVMTRFHSEGASRCRDCDRRDHAGGGDGSLAPTGPQLACVEA